MNVRIQKVMQHWSSYFRPLKSRDHNLQNSAEKFFKSVKAEIKTDIFCSVLYLIIPLKCSCYGNCISSEF